MMYTTAVILKLPEKGRVVLDAPVTRYLSNFTMAVQASEVGGFALCGASGTPGATSWAFVDTSVVLLEGGWMLFSSDPGSHSVRTPTPAQEN